LREALVNEFFDSVGGGGWRPLPEDSGRSPIFDGNGHGTKVAGLIAAEHCEDEDDQRYLRCRGVAPKVRILNFRLADRDGGTKLKRFKKAVRKLCDRADEAAAASKGKPDRDKLERIPVVVIALDDKLWRRANGRKKKRKKKKKLLKKLLKKLNKSRLLVVLPSGDNDSNLKEVPMHPGVLGKKLGNVLTVAPADLHGRLRRQANWSSRYVDVAAPGVDLLSVAPLGPATVNGGSGAAALVAGVAALLFAQAKKKTSPAKIKRQLLRHCTRKENKLAGKVRGSRALYMS